MSDGQNLRGLKILVTHVAHFVGLPAARAMAGQGAAVVCHDHGFADESVLLQFRKSHPELLAIEAREPEEVVAQCNDLFGRIDVLVCNDAYPAIRAPVEMAELDDMRAGLEALVTVPFAFAKAVVPQMKERRRGKILFVTSAAPLRGLPNYSMYAAARGGANALAVSLASELARFSIQVNAIAPNFVESPTYFPDELLADGATMKKIASKIPLGRLAKPEEAAALVAYFASPQADFITGHVMPFAGGWA